MCVCFPYVLFLFPSRYTTSSIRLHTYVHGRSIKRASTATSGHHSAQQNELFLWKNVSAIRCGSSLYGTSVDVRMQTYRRSCVPRSKEEEDIRETHAHTTLTCTPPTYRTYTPPFLLFHQTYHYHAKVHILQQTRYHNFTSTETTYIYTFVHNHHKIQHLYTPVDLYFAISRESLVNGRVQILYVVLVVNECVYVCGFCGRTIMASCFL